MPRKPFRVTTRGFAVSTDDSFLKDALSEMSFELLQEAREAAGSVAEFLINDITNRTLLGRDVGGRVFKSYSEDYGRYVKGRLQPVDLTLDNNSVLGSLEVEPFEGGFSVSTDSALGYIHQFGVGHMPVREWFGVSGVAEKEAERIFNERITNWGLQIEEAAFSMQVDLTYTL